MRGTRRALDLQTNRWVDGADGLVERERNELQRGVRNADIERVEHRVAEQQGGTGRADAALEWRHARNENSETGADQRGERV